MPRAPLTSHQPPLTVSADQLLDRIGTPVIDLAPNRVAVSTSSKLRENRYGLTALCLEHMI